MKASIIAYCLLTILATAPASAVDLIGQTVSKSPISVVAEVDGVLISAGLEAGEAVSEKQIIAQIQPADFELEVAKQHANVELAQADLKLKKSVFQRYQTLMSKNSLSANELDIAQAEYLNAKARLKLANIELKKAKKDLDDTAIAANIDGYVIARSADIGAWVSQGELLYQLVNTNTLMVRLSASEQDLTGLTVGQKIEFWAETAPKTKIIATIKRIGVEIEPQSMAYPVELEFDNIPTQFKPGMSIHASTQITPEQ